MINPPERFIEFDEHVTRCPRCGKRLTNDASACLACGYEMVPHHQRIRCVHCKYRIPADVVVCPRCQQDPRPKPLPPAMRLGAIVLAVVLVLACVGWIAYRALTTDVLGRAFGKAEPTRPATIIQIFYVIATPVAPTPTLMLPPTSVPTPNVSPSATRRGARGTPSAIPTVPPPGYAAPQLVAPLNALIFPNADTPVVLEWQTVAPAGLRENEWYAITVTYTARDGKPTTQTRWTKETRWLVPVEWHTDAAPEARTFHWQVSVVRVQGIDPITAPSRVPISPPSASRTFIWQINP